MFQIESIKGNTVTVRHGVLTFKVYVGDNGFVEIPKKVWIDADKKMSLISVVSTAFYAEKSKRSLEVEEYACGRDG